MQIEEKHQPESHRAEMFIQAVLEYGTFRFSKYSFIQFPDVVIRVDTLFAAATVVATRYLFILMIYLIYSKRGTNFLVFVFFPSFLGWLLL